MKITCPKYAYFDTSNQLIGQNKLRLTNYHFLQSIAIPNKYKCVNMYFEIISNFL